MADKHPDDCWLCCYNRKLPRPALQRWILGGTYQYSRFAAPFSAGAGGAAGTRGIAAEMGNISGMQRLSTHPTNNLL